MVLKILIFQIRCSPHVLQLVECSSCLTDAYSYICVSTAQLDDAAKFSTSSSASLSTLIGTAFATLTLFLALLTLSPSCEDVAVTVHVLS